ncbi:MAG TPA: hypothetical protein VGF28_08585 [Thermoanaerobaculia bacterium]
MIDVLGTLLDYTLLALQNWWPVLLILVASWYAPPLPGLFDRIAAAFDRLAERRLLATALVVLLAMSWAASSWLLRSGIPQPAMHDDHAVLLGGKMFANGRAAYPTHPLWPHFEQFHVLQVPKYASKYPLGNELLLALGIRLTGIPLMGAMVAAGLACAAVFWALLAALPPRWALAGAMATAIHPLLLNWSQSYRGGGLAAAGGALLIGATLRMATAPSPRLGAIAGAGLAMLATSRPYEGVVLAAGCALGLLCHRRRGLLVPAAVAVLVVAVLALLPIALHNRAVTGSYTTLPWQAYARQYDPAPQFVWEKAGPVPRYRNEEFRYIYEIDYRKKFDRVTAPGGLWQEIDRKIYFMQWMLTADPETRRPALQWPIFLFPLALLPVALWRDRYARMAAVMIVVFAFAPLSQFVNILTHYLAPVTAAVALMMMLLLRRMSVHHRGRWLAVAIFLTFLVHAGSLLGWTQRNSAERRAKAVAAAGEGKHLFLVAPDVFDVVYNGPDIDQQRVLWARDLGDNRALLAYYSDRKVWRVEKTGGRDLRLVRLR